MSRVNVLQPAPLFKGADMSSTLTSDVIDYTHLSGFSVHLEWKTSDIEGEFSLQVSNTGKDWVSIPNAELSGVPIVEGANGVGFINVTQHQGYKFRLVFNPSSGSDGLLNAWVGGKGL